MYLTAQRLISPNENVYLPTSHMKQAKAMIGRRLIAFSPLPPRGIALVQASSAPTVSYTFLLLAYLQYVCDSKYFMFCFPSVYLLPFANSVYPPKDSTVAALQSNGKKKTPTRKTATVSVKLRCLRYLVRRSTTTSGQEVVVSSCQRTTAVFLSDTPIVDKYTNTR